MSAPLLGIGCSLKHSKLPVTCVRSAGVEAHEIWAYDDHRMIQKLNGLISLCPKCHEVKHIGFAIEQGRAAQVTEWLCTINQITAEQALAYIQYAFKVHSIRSQFKWQLDLTVLSNKYGIKLDKYGIEQGLNGPLPS